eukprot:TRINITY_DN37155_c0_g2_i1.p1 TRINITY_DN37155_c0_g2~~TRINITY_DN37155_c0_g2_i1.p1  ORF type:complete len:939 (-),score=160.30 TRINITY_DN37155_c0_g2_i1:143-2959(-)
MAAVNVELRMLASGRTLLTLPVDRSISVKNLRQHLLVNDVLPKTHGLRPIVSLLHSGKELHVESSLHDAGIEDGSVVDVVLSHARVCKNCATDDDFTDDGTVVDSDKKATIVLKCCRERVCKECFQYQVVWGSRDCIFCNAVAPSVTGTSVNKSTRSTSSMQEEEEEEVHGVVRDAGPDVLGDAPVPVLDATWIGKPTPRPYQTCAFRKAVQDNRIVHMPTGAGKTLVAVMLVDHFIEHKPNHLVLLIVPTVSLAEQHSSYLSEHSTHKDLIVKELTGDRVVWTEEAWAEHRQSQVVVTTAETLRRAIVDFAFLRPHEISLMIFDEAHHAIRRHPYVEIVKRLVDSATDACGTADKNIPRIVGFTASFLHGHVGNPREKRDQLEKNLRAQLWVADDEMMEPVRRNQRFERVCYDDTCFERSDFEWLEEATGRCLEPLTQIAELSKLGEKARSVFVLLGKEGWRLCMAEGIYHTALAILEKKRSAEENEEILEKKRRDVELVRGLQDQLRSRCDDIHHGPGSIPQLTGKAKALLTRLEELYHYYDSEMRCLVFVEQVVTVHPLSALINGRFERDISRPVSGAGSMRECVRRENLARFRDGQTQILVATSSLEEGIDVPDCNIVVRFDRFNTVRAHIQGVGRARKDDAVILYFDNDCAAEEASAQRVQEAARASGTSSVARPMADRSSRGNTTLRFSIPFKHPDTEAELNIDNCVKLLHEYVAVVSKGLIKADAIFDGGDQITACRAPVSHGKLHEVTEMEVAKFWRDVRGLPGPPEFQDFWCVLGHNPGRSRNWEKRRFAFVTVWELLTNGFIDEHYRPTEAVRTSFLDGYERPEHESQVSHREVLHFAAHHAGVVPSISGSTADQAASSAARSPMREWCKGNKLPDELADRLEDQLLRPEHLSELNSKDIDFLTRGLKLGPKCRFKRFVKREVHLQGR